MNFASTNSGIGAPEVAWAKLGWKSQWVSEIDKFPNAVLAHHNPHVPNLGDMNLIHERKEFSERSIDVLVGGTPCQSFSVAGRRAGLDDPRGNLTLVYFKIAERLRPRWVVWENVPGVMSADRGRVFGTVLGTMAKLGYGFAYRILDAQFFGVPQRRRRVFVVGYLGDWRRAAAVLFERQSLSGDIAPSRKAREEIAGTLAARTRGGGGFGTDFEVAGGLQVIPLLEIGARTNGDGYRDGDGIDKAGDPMYTLQAPKQHGVARCLTAPRGGNATTRRPKRLSTTPPPSPFTAAKTRSLHSTAREPSGETEGERRACLTRGKSRRKQIGQCPHPVYVTRSQRPQRPQRLSVAGWYAVLCRLSASAYKASLTTLQRSLIAAGQPKTGPVTKQSVIQWRCP